jgi:ATP-dependent Lon protease
MSQVADALTHPIPLLPLRSGVILPGSINTFPVGRPKSKHLVERLKPDALIAIGFQRTPEVEEPGLDDLHEIGVVARVRQVTRRGERGLLLGLEALDRFRLTEVTQETPFYEVRGTIVEETVGDEDRVTALAEALRGRLKELAGSDVALQNVVSSTRKPGLLADRIAAWLDVDAESKVAVLEELEVEHRLEQVAELITKAKGRAELRQKIDSQVRKELSKNQREAVLRQQLRAIQKELGGDEEDDVARLRRRLDEAELPEEAREAADRELRRLESMGGQGPEVHVIRTYLEWLADMPWNRAAEASTDLDRVATVLDEDHYGLEDVKQRILEHMAVLKLSGKSQGTLLCLVGPPGVGKTSLAQSVARATHRPLQRISLGGVRDEAEIRGHRRTYVGALPGRLVQALKKAKVHNPVVVLDEIDKLGRGWSGDPEAALLEVLDPEQNKNFTDHYLEVPFDLSGVLFIATANELGHLSAPLRDRLEVIELTGYTAEEKARIARSHLIPKQLAEHGLDEGSVELGEGALDALIRDYTREAGVRQLSRQIARLFRAAALEVARAGGEAGTAEVGDSGAASEAAASEEGAAETPATPPVRTIDADELSKHLGRPKYVNEVAERTSVAGVASGLAWTPVGGDVLFIETTRMPGKGRLEITGQLGDVMKESARAALAYVRSHADELQVDPAFLDSQDLHLHVPAGAVPKDGPSAGVTIFTALASLLSGRAVRSDTAMTGEVTLRGRVLPVGGIKAKVLAAHRAGFSRVILPKRNEQDLEDVPESARSALEFILAEDMSTVLNHALEPEATGTLPEDADDPSRSATAPSAGSPGAGADPSGGHPAPGA